FAAAFHLTQLLNANPDDPRLRLRLAAVRLHTESATLPQLAAAALDRLGPTPSPQAARAAAWLCAFSPAAASEVPPALRLGPSPGGEARGGSLLLGALLSRAGRYGEAVEHLKRVPHGLDLPTSPAPGRTDFLGERAIDLSGCLFLALAHQRLGHDDEARH